MTGDIPSRCVVITAVRHRLASTISDAPQVRSEYNPKGIEHAQKKMLLKHELEVKPRTPSRLTVHTVSSLCTQSCFALIFGTLVCDI